MQGTDIAFLITISLLVITSLLVVVIKNPVRATFMLILSFFPTTVVYFFLHASFVGVLQILVYAGAILVLFTFVVMMVNPAPNEGEAGTEAEKPRSRLVAAGAALVILAALVPVFLTAALPVDGAVREDFGSLKSIGRMLFENPAENPYILSFELLSFLVLAAIIAAVSLARGRGEKPARGQKPGQESVK